MKMMADYRKILPSLVLDIVKFFDINNAIKTYNEAGGCVIQSRTVQDFLEHIKENFQSQANGLYPQPEPVNKICQKLVDLGYLSPTRAVSGTNFGDLDNTYLGRLEEGLEQENLVIQLNNAVYGWSSIYDSYQRSVIPISFEDDNCDKSIGTAFIINPYIIVTAAYCILNAKTISVRNLEQALLQKAAVHVSLDPAIDLAIIHLGEPFFKNVPPIPIATGYVLDDVMVLGYPNVPGFHPTVAAEKALISSRLTAVQGIVSSTPEEIFTRSSLFLITARVRGGFSGGPVLNSSGACVGVVSREPVSHVSNDAGSSYHTYDNLGYGTAIPSNLLSQLLNELNSLSFVHSRKLEVGEVTWVDFV